MKRWSSLIHGFLLVLCSAIGLDAQGPFSTARMAAQTYGLEEGLPSATVHSLLLDSKGFLWAGTQEGAAYMGGQGWTPLRFPESGRSAFIRTMLESKDGSLWFGTQDDGLWRFKRGRWTHYKGGSELPVSRINSLLETQDAQGRSVVWAGTWGAGVWRFQEERWTQFPIPSEILDANIWKIREFSGPNQSRQLWVASEKGIAFLADGAWTRMGTAQGYREGGCNDLIEVLPADGRPSSIWASCWGNGVARWDGTTWAYFGIPEGFSSRNPTCLEVSKDPGGKTTLWAGTFDAGLAWYRDGSWHRFNGRGGLLGATGIYAILSNPGLKPRLWVGSRGNGVSAVDPSGWRTLDKESGLPSSEASCFLETRENPGKPVFWIGTNKGVAHWEGDRIIVETTADGLPDNFVYALDSMPGPAGPEIWAVTLQGMARRIRGRWTPFKISSPIPWTKPLCALRVLEPGKAPVMLLGMEGGIARYSNGHWEAIGTEQGLPNANVTALYWARDSAGGPSLWAGFRGGGAALYKGGHWTVFGQPMGLPPLPVFRFVESRSPDGRRWLWAGTLGGGLARVDMDRIQNGWESFDSRRLPGLKSNFIQGLVLDRKNRLYLTTPQGVERVSLGGPDGAPREVTTFSTGDGLPSPTSNFGATYLDSEGRLWVGTAKGVGVLDPDTETQPLRPQGPILERVRAGESQLPTKENLRFSYQVDSLAFEFAYPFYHRRADIRYRTQLMGLESEPGPWRKEAQREFTGLSHGRYVLRIWAEDFAGMAPNFLDVPFFVEAAPWRRWWAYLIYGLAASGGVLLILRMRTRFLQERTNILAAQVASRTRELAQANEALRAQSLTDPLTGLNNRRFVDVGMVEAVARILRRYTREAWHPEDPHILNRDMVFLILDLDHFKAVNDTFGHEAGDRVLQQTSAILLEAMRDVDRIVRWGGEEFLVVAMDTNHAEAPVLAERIRLRIKAHLFDLGNGRTMHKTASIGFACFPLIYADPACFTWEQVLNLADQCLYEAKELGRDRWVGVVPCKNAPPTLDIDPQSCKVGDLVNHGFIEKFRSE